jgi:hypothetical protein
MPKRFLSWKAKEFDKNHKGKLWFISFGIISIGFLLLAWYWKSFTMITFLILSVFLIIIYALKEPRILDIEINSSGISANKDEYRFSDIESFWIFYDPPYTKELSLKQKKMFFPHTYIPLGKKDPSKIRKILLSYLPEERQEESIIDNITRILKF